MTITLAPWAIFVLGAVVGSLLTVIAAFIIAWRGANHGSKNG
jgi:uncharacterized membrane protein YoaK (UPF0700 family)